MSILFLDSRFYMLLLHHAVANSSAMRAFLPPILVAKFSALWRDGLYFSKKLLSFKIRAICSKYSCAPIS